MNHKCNTFFALTTLRDFRSICLQISFWLLIFNTYRWKKHIFHIFKPFIKFVNDRQSLKNILNGLLGLSMVFFIPLFIFIYKLISKFVCINVLFSGITGICLSLVYEKLQNFKFVHESTCQHSALVTLNTYKLPDKIISMKLT